MTRSAPTKTATYSPKKRDGFPRLPSSRGDYEKLPDEIGVHFPRNRLAQILSGVFRNLVRDKLLGGEVAKWEAEGICPVCEQPLFKKNSKGKRTRFTSLERVHHKNHDRPTIVLSLLQFADRAGESLELIHWDIICDKFLQYHWKNKCLAVACVRCHRAYDGKTYRGKKVALTKAQNRRLGHLFKTVDWSSPDNKPARGLPKKRRNQKC
jgi:hypothetical protein